MIIRTLKHPKNRTLAVLQLWGNIVEVAESRGMRSQSEKGPLPSLQEAIRYFNDKMREYIGRGFQEISRSRSRREFVEVRRTFLRYWWAVEGHRSDLFIHHGMFGEWAAGPRRVPFPTKEEAVQEYRSLIAMKLRSGWHRVNHWTNRWTQDETQWGAMAELYYVEVLEVQRDELVCLVISLYPSNDNDLPASPSLALQFLADPWYDAHNVVIEDFGDHGLSSPQPGLYAPIGAGPVKQRITQSSIGTAVPADWDPDFFRKQTDRFIRSVQVRDKRHCRRQRYRTFGPRPEGTYHIRVTEARWLEHLIPGMSWSTRAYPMESPS